MPSQVKVADAMIRLSRGGKSRRVIVAGPASEDVFRELCRRGYSRLTSTSNNGVPSGEYDLAIVVWSRHSIRALESNLDWLVHFIRSVGVLVFWVGPEVDRRNRQLKGVIEGLGFRIKSRAACQGGLVVCAGRPDLDDVAKFR